MDLSQDVDALRQLLSGPSSQSSAPSALPPSSASLGSLGPADSAAFDDFTGAVAEQWQRWEAQAQVGRVEDSRAVDLRGGWRGLGSIGASPAQQPPLGRGAEAVDRDSGLFDDELDDREDDD